MFPLVSSLVVNKRTINTSTVNTHVYIEILDNFHILSKENWSGNLAICQDNNTSCHRAKRVKASLLEKYIKSMTWPENSSDLNPMENSQWKFKKGSMRKFPPPRKRY